MITIPLVSPKSANLETVKSIVENGKEGIVAFLGFLGAVVGLLQHVGVKSTDMESEDDVKADEHVSAPSIEKYKSKLHETYNAAVKLREIAHRNRHIGIKAMSYRVAVNVALIFAICHIVTAGMQGVLHRAYPPRDLDGAIFFIVAFSQTLMLCVCSALVPAFCFRRFLAHTKFSSESNSSGSVFRVGGLGIFTVGVASLATLSPEQLFVLLGNESFLDLPIFHVNYLVYLSALRLVVLPVIGIVTCFVARKRRLAYFQEIPVDFRISYEVDFSSRDHESMARANRFMEPTEATMQSSPRGAE